MVSRLPGDSKAKARDESERIVLRALCPLATGIARQKQCEKCSAKKRAATTGSPASTTATVSISDSSRDTRDGQRVGPSWASLRCLGETPGTRTRAHSDSQAVITVDSGLIIY